MATTVTQTASASEPDTEKHHGWRIRRGWEHLLAGAEAPDWFALEDDPRATLVKRGHDRTVWRVTCADRVVFAKVASTGGWLGRIKAFLVGTAALREWGASSQAEARGVAVPLALGVAVRGGRVARTVFLSEGLPGAVGLLDAWRERVGGVSGAPRRRAGDTIITAVAGLMAKAHARGFVHGDGHPYNILLCPDARQGWRAFFVDVHGARVSARFASRVHRLRALAELDQSFHRHATRLERLRFLRRYLAPSPASGVPKERHWELRPFLEGLGRASSVHAAGLARRRDRRLRRSGKYFRTMVAPGGWSVTVALALERRHLFPEPDIPDRSPGDWRRIFAAVLDDIEAGRCAADSAARFGLAIEVRRFRGLVARLLGSLWRLDHRGQFDASHRARHRDEMRELILAFGVRRRLGLVRTTFLVRPSGGKDGSAVSAVPSKDACHERH